MLLNEQAVQSFCKNWGGKVKGIYTEREYEEIRKQLVEETASPNMKTKGKCKKDCNEKKRFICEKSTYSNIFMENWYSVLFIVLILFCTVVICYQTHFCLCCCEKKKNGTVSVISLQPSKKDSFD